MRFTHVGSLFGIEPHGGGGDGDDGVGLLNNPRGPKGVVFVRVVVVRPLVIVGMLRYAARDRKQHDVFTPKLVSIHTCHCSLRGFSRSSFKR